MPERVDVLGVGLGPFNLGLAALLDGAETDLDPVFLEQDSEFAWHEGMLIEGTTLEVPFLADLVTLADPTNQHSYLNYARETDRIYELYFYERFQTPRREYNDYMQWVSERLDSCRFSRRVTDVTRTEDGAFAVTARHPETGERFDFRAESLVLGVGSRPHVPEELAGHPERDVFHTARYRSRKQRCLDADSITVVGSGQSAAEVFQDLLEAQVDHDYRLDWLTRSEGFFPMEYSKLGLQHFTPEYTEYFASLPEGTREDVLADQDLLYKGIDEATSAEIYDLLYQRSIGDRAPDVGLFAMTEVNDIERRESTAGPDYRLDCHQWQADESFTHDSDVVILGTGYHRPVPGFLSGIDEHIEWEQSDRLPVQEDYRLAVADDLGDIFVQNAGLHVHGVGTPDLGLGCYRNAQIINQLCGRPVYPADSDTVFQDFAVEEFIDRRRPTAASAMED